MGGYSHAGLSVAYPKIQSLVDWSLRDQVRSCLIAKTCNEPSMDGELLAKVYRYEYSNPSGRLTDEFEKCVVQIHLWK